MAEQKPPNEPNRASGTTKAEGERWTPESENAGVRERSGYLHTDDDAAGITNRPLDEEMANQASLPERGKSRPGAHAGHGHKNQS
jgi:hypothetical protein